MVLRLATNAETKADIYRHQSISSADLELERAGIFLDEDPPQTFNMISDTPSTGSRTGSFSDSRIFNHNYCDILCDEDHEFELYPLTLQGSMDVSRGHYI